MTGFHQTIYGQEGQVSLHAPVVELSTFQLPALRDFPFPKATALSEEIERLKQTYNELFPFTSSHLHQTKSNDPRSISI